MNYNKLIYQVDVLVSHWVRVTVPIPVQKAGTS